MKKTTLTISLVFMASMTFGQSKMTPELRLNLLQANRTAAESVASPLRRAMPMDDGLQVVIRTPDFITFLRHHIAQNENQ